MPKGKSAMISEIEKEGDTILQQFNNQGRRLERTSPAYAARNSACTSAKLSSGRPRWPKTRAGRREK